MKHGMKMPDRTQLVRILLFSLYFAVAFLVFLVLQFPYDRIRTRLETEVRTRTPFELTVARISPRFLNRFVLDDVVLADGSGNVLFESPSVSAHVSLFGFLQGLLSADLEGKAYGGELKVRTQQGAKRRFLAVDANGLDLGAYPPLRGLGPKVSGRTGGSFEMTDGSGKGRVWFKELAGRELKIMGFAVPDLDFEQGWIEAEVRGDRLTVRKLELDGKELSIRMNGDLVMRERGTLNLSVRLKPSERLAAEQAGLLSLLKTRDAEGFYQFSLGGTLDSPLPRL
jgi:type II secretion system protein N